jgi:hypothetical protein
MSTQEKANEEVNGMIRAIDHLASKLTFGCYYMKN